MSLVVMLRMNIWVISLDDFNARRGRIEAMEMRGGSRVIKAFVPLDEMFGYATRVADADPGPGRIFHGIFPI